jgi:Fur family peroxide stress response transcriptional regulator
MNDSLRPAYLRNVERMSMIANSSDRMLRAALEASGQRFTEQRAAVFRYLARTEVHPTADEVLVAVRHDLPGISLATVYKSLETLVGCGLAVKLTYGDHSARYDGRTDPHHHARCVVCERVVDLIGEIAPSEIEALRDEAAGFTVTGYRLELAGYCSECVPRPGRKPVSA